MSVPVSQMATVALYLAKQKLQGRKRYPLALMLEPLYRCNLACAGCGKIQYPSNILKTQLSYEDCMKAVDECPAPVVSIPGGEPLLHPEIDRIVRGLIERKKYIYLCTNALLLEEKIDLFEPSKYLSFSVHMDGLEKDHDFSVCRDGTFKIARAAIELAVSRGFRVTTNTTLFDGADPKRTQEFFDEMMTLGVEGMMVSPGYSYQKAARPGETSSAGSEPRNSSEKFSTETTAAGNSTSRCSSSNSWPAVGTTIARRGATRPTASSAGKNPATCSRTATRTASRA